MLMDTTREIEEMQNKLWMEKSLDERAGMMFGMFAMARRHILSSLPNGLSVREIKEQVYFRTYGESLPDDFFTYGEK